MTITELEARLRSAILEEQMQKIRAATALAEREELCREFVFETMARELGRDTAMRALQRIRLVDRTAVLSESLDVAPKVVPT
jgi:hypothetical protein